VRASLVAATTILAMLGGAAAIAAERPTTALRVTVWPKGVQATERPRSWTLRCGPAGGSLPKPQRACRALGGLDAPFAPVPRGALCGALYGGPAVALVRGTFRGTRIWTRFKRDNLCQSNRWDRVRFLFPVRT
jgi:Subtilisin inhibitor-like